MEFSRREYWSELPFPSSGDLPDPGIKLWSLAMQADCLPSVPPGKWWEDVKGVEAEKEKHRSNFSSRVAWLGPWRETGECSSQRRDGRSRREGWGMVEAGERGACGVWALGLCLYMDIYTSRWCILPLGTLWGHIDPGSPAHGCPEPVWKSLCFCTSLFRHTLPEVSKNPCLPVQIWMLFHSLCSSQTHTQCPASTRCPQTLNNQCWLLSRLSPPGLSWCPNESPLAFIWGKKKKKKMVLCHQILTATCT